MSKIIFKIQTRDNQKANQLRKLGIVPGNIYGLNKDSQMIQFSKHDIEHFYAQSSDANLIYLKMEKENKEIPVLLDEVQMDPVTDDILHVSFKRIDLSNKTIVEIPIELVGEVDVPQSVLVTVRSSVEVEALPTDLPEKIVVDVSSLTEIGQSITLADLDYDKNKVDLIVGEEGIEAPVVILQAVEEEPEEEPEETLEDTLLEDAEGVKPSEGEEDQEEQSESPKDKKQETEGQK